MRTALVILALAIAGCATTPPPSGTPASDPPPAEVELAPLRGSRLALWTVDGGLEVEVLQVGRASASHFREPLSLEATVATAPGDLKGAFTPPGPVDFSRWVAITMEGGSSAPVEVVEVAPSLLRSTPEQTEVLYRGFMPACGGATSTHAQNQIAFNQLRRRILLVPRPAKRLVIGLEDHRCGVMP